MRVVEEEEPNLRSFAQRFSSSSWPSTIIVIIMSTEKLTFTYKTTSDKHGGQVPIELDLHLPTEQPDSKSPLKIVLWFVSELYLLPSLELYSWSDFLLSFSFDDHSTLPSREHGGGLVQGTRSAVPNHFLQSPNKYKVAFISADYRVSLSDMSSSFDLYWFYAHSILHLLSWLRKFEFPTFKMTLQIVWATSFIHCLPIYPQRTLLSLWIPLQ